MIEEIFTIRKSRFLEFPRLISELDILEEDDIVTHELDFDEEKVDGRFELDAFAFNPEYEM